MADFELDLQSLIDLWTRYATKRQSRFDQEISDRVNAEVNQIRQASVRSYDEFYALIANEQADIKARQAACSILQHLLYRDIRPMAKKKRVDGRRALSPLLAASRSSETELRLEAIQALGRLRNKRAFNSLRAALTDETLGIRFAAIDALAMLNDPRAISELAHFAHNKSTDQGERVHAVYGLGFYNEPEAISAALEIMQDKTDDVEVRAQAAETLASISRREDQNKLIPLYLDALQETSVQMRFWSAYGIVTMIQCSDLPFDLNTLDRVVAYDEDAPLRWW
jgi:HEAT repeat protein